MSKLEKRIEKNINEMRYMGIGLNMVEMSECDTYVNLMQIFKKYCMRKGL